MRDLRKKYLKYKRKYVERRHREAYVLPEQTYRVPPELLIDEPDQNRINIVVDEVVETNEDFITVRANLHYYKIVRYTRVVEIPGDRPRAYEVDRPLRELIPQIQVGVNITLIYVPLEGRYSLYESPETAELSGAKIVNSPFLVVNHNPWFGSLLTNQEDENNTYYINGTLIRNSGSEGEVTVGSEIYIGELPKTSVLSIDEENKVGIIIGDLVGGVPAYTVFELADINVDERTLTSGTLRQPAIPEPPYICEVTEVLTPNGVIRDPNEISNTLRDMAQDENIKVYRVLEEE